MSLDATRFAGQSSVPIINDGSGGRGRQCRGGFSPRRIACWLATRCSLAHASTSATQLFTALFRRWMICDRGHSRASSGVCGIPGGSTGNVA
jgi:hypothetical protein